MLSGAKLAKRIYSFMIRVCKFMHLKQAYLGKYIEVELFCLENI